MRVYKNNYKAHMDNNKERWKQRKEVGRAGVAWWGPEKMEKTVLAQQIKKVLKMYHSHEFIVIFQISCKSVL